jgi:CheY-like chemotaxis protein
MGGKQFKTAQTLKPDLILLDIGLPNLTGIEAANRIHQLVPGTKLIFITANNDKEVVRAALRTGAQGYVLKVDAGTQLLTAVAGVVGGDDFVSSGIKRSDSVETKDTVMTKPCPICKRQLVKKEPTDTTTRLRQSCLAGVTASAQHVARNFKILSVGCSLAFRLLDRASGEQAQSYPSRLRFVQPCDGVVLHRLRKPP